MDKKLFLAMPNFSEAKDMNIVEKIVDVARGVDGVKLVKYEPEGEFNRTVVTVLGEIEPLKEVITQLTVKCVELIDMRKHVGTHPRMGAMDIIPVYPFKNTDIDEAITFCKELGQRIFKETNVPIFYTSANATCEQRKSLPFIRKGQFEGLRNLLIETKNCADRAHEYELRKPDLSIDGLLNETAGGTAIGAYTNIVAFLNIFLDTEDLSVAKKIADSIRSAKGGFSTVQAIGIKFDGRSGTVVSMNIMDCTTTPIYRPFEIVKLEAERYGARITGSELIGTVKLDSIINCFEHQLQLEGFKKEYILETHLM